MSILAMTHVFASGLDRNHKAIALAYADHCHDDGSNIYPSIDYTVWKTGYSRRSVQKITAELVEMGVLIPVGTTRSGTNEYRMDFGKLPEREPYRNRDENGENNTKPTEKGVQKLHGGGAKTARGGVQKLHVRGAKTAPKPLVNHNTNHNNNHPPAVIPNQSQKKPNASGGGKTHPVWEIPESLRTPEFEAAWIAWFKHRAEIKNYLTQTSGDLVLIELEKMGVARAVKAIYLSIAKGWKNIYEGEPKGGASSNGRDTSRNQAPINTSQYHILD